MDRLHLIKVFVAVVDSQGFAAAARKLKIAPSAVTRAINELEKHLGTRLLSRTTRVVRVTEAGERYAADCRRIQAELAEAGESVIGMHAVPRGRLSITAPVLFGAKLVTPIVIEYLHRYPQVSAACWFLDRIVNMMDEGVDVAIRIGELPDSSLQSIKVGQVRRMVCAAPSYLAQHGIPKRPADLHAHCIVAAVGVTPLLEWRFLTSGAATPVKLQARLTTTSNDSAVAAAVAGFGVTRLLSYQIEQQLRDGTLTALLSEFESKPLPVHVVHREGRHASSKARAFVDLAVQTLRTHPVLA